MGEAVGQREAALAPALVARDAIVAARAVRLAAGRRLLLLSAPGAAAWLGARGWRALVRAATGGAPAEAVQDALCCGGAPGFALDALREGCRILVLDGGCPGFAAVAGAAQEAGALLLPARPASLDLRELDLSRPAGQARLAQWLAGAPDDSAPIWR